MTTLCNSTIDFGAHVKYSENYEKKKKVAQTDYLANLNKH
jgi:hypothetical protein